MKAKTETPKGKAPATPGKPRVPARVKVKVRSAARGKTPNTGIIKGRTP